MVSWRRSAITWWPNTVTVIRVAVVGRTSASMRCQKLMCWTSSRASVRPEPRSRALEATANSRKCCGAAAEPLGPQHPVARGEVDRAVDALLAAAGGRLDREGIGRVAEHLGAPHRAHHAMLVDRAQRGTCSQRR